MNFYPFPILIEEIPDFVTYESDEAINFIISNWFNPMCKGGVNVSTCYPIGIDDSNITQKDIALAYRKWAEVMWDWKRVIRRLQQPEDIETNEYVAERCP